MKTLNGIEKLAADGLIREYERMVESEAFEMMKNYSNKNFEVIAVHYLDRIDELKKRIEVLKFITTQ